MAEAHGPLAHHFDDLDQQKSAVRLGMWLFLVTEVMFFGGLFMAYILYRWAYPEAFVAASRRLDVGLGATNTVVLITSSLTMALAVWAAEHGKRRLTSLLLVATIALGAVFLAIKGVEYSHKIHEGLVPGRSFTFVAEGVDPRHARIFFVLYFAMTGLHAFHMVIGFGILGWLLAKNMRGKILAEYSSPVEVSGLYWHFVDIVWIFLFPLLYLVSRH